MTITEIYDKYRINKGLREHMIRVTAVAKMICDNSVNDVDTENVVKAALLHDMGNIVKSKFEIGPELYEPEGIEYYRKVQQEVIEKYGKNDHEATLAMLAELDVDKKIIKTINATGITNVPRVANDGSNEEKLMTYSDLRAGPFGIISLDERLNDVEDRHVPRFYTKEMVETGRKLMKEIEREIFKNSKISPKDITDESIKEIQKELWNWEI